MAVMRWCAEALHRRNQRCISPYMAARSVAFLGHKASYYVWSQDLRAARGDSVRARGKRRCSHFQTREMRRRRGMRGASINPGMDLTSLCVAGTAQ